MTESIRPSPRHLRSVSRRAVLLGLVGAALSRPGLAGAADDDSPSEAQQTKPATHGNAPFRRAGRFAVKLQQAS